MRICINYLKCHLFMRVYEWHGTRKLAPIIFGLNGHCPLLFCQQCVQFLANKRKQSLNWKIPLEMLLREEVLGGSRLTRVLLKPSWCRCVLKRSAVEAVEQIILCQTNMILQLPHTHTHVDQNKSIKRYTLTTILLLLYWPSTILYPARLRWAVIRPQRAEIEVWHVALTGVVSEPGGKLGGQRSIAAKSNLWSRQPSSGSSRAATFISQSSSRNIKTNCWSNSEQKAWRQRHHNQWDH